jgi:hypothetical protein
MRLLTPDFIELIECCVRRDVQFPGDEVSSVLVEFGELHRSMMRQPIPTAT